MAALLRDRVCSWRCFSVLRSTPVALARKDGELPESKNRRNKNRDDKNREIACEPKTPAKPFAMYFRDEYEQIKSGSENMTPGGLMSIASAAWKNLPESVKEKYNMKYKEKYERYLDDVYKFYMQPKECDNGYEYTFIPNKRILKILQQKAGKPTHPKSGFLNFSIQYAKSLGRRFVIPEGLLEGKRKWDQLSESEKMEYNEKAKIERELYGQKLLEWEKKMIERGCEFLVRNKSYKLQKDVSVIDQ